MIDSSIVGQTVPEYTADIERGRLQLFAKAIGETDPIYFDVAAARAAGHPDLLVPPTFLTGLANEDGALLRVLIGAGGDLGRLLHGQESVRYYQPLHAGDRVRMAAGIGDVYQKKGGALDFVVSETRVVSDDGGAHVADLRSVLVFRNPEVAK